VGVGVVGFNRYCPRSLKSEANPSNDEMAFMFAEKGVGGRDSPAQSTPTPTPK
jgi:hypothetical protein